MGDWWSGNDVGVLESEIEEVRMITPPYHTIQRSFRRELEVILFIFIKISKLQGMEAVSKERLKVF
jgi:hypothetical protein